jgi:hypothetical protein
MRNIDRLVDSQCGEYYGWHDERAVPDRAAFQQDRREFESMLVMICDQQLIGGACLQLGMGPSGVSHDVWQMLFRKVVTIDLSIVKINHQAFMPGYDTHSHEAMTMASRHASFDFLFIDAGHTLQDVAADYYTYQQFVRTGGLITFHDALERDGYPEVKVHEFIKKMPVTVFGTEVGTAVMVKA